MTTILSDYNKSILIELLNTNRQIIVVHGDDIDEALLQIVGGDKLIIPFC
ncbi:hypothetical protein ACUNMU_005552 [Escherichia coli]